MVSKAETGPGARGSAQLVSESFIPHDKSSWCRCVRALDHMNTTWLLPPVTYFGVLGRAGPSSHVPSTWHLRHFASKDPSSIGMIGCTIRICTLCRCTAFARLFPFLRLAIVLHFCERVRPLKTALPASHHQA